jgi:23S rRNA (uracil1939-C5)-methyltransferase
MENGQLLDLVIERPAAGGRMIARHEGAVLLVAGGIPGERVEARVTRVEKRVAFADVVRVLEPSPDRRDPVGDPACGGCVYAEIAYPRQIELKAAIIRDAFARIGKIPLEQEIVVAPSPERGYRMRARFHVADGRIGFFREGSHQLCEPRQTGQLLEASLEGVEAAVASLAAQGAEVIGVELAETIAADQRALHLAVRELPRGDALERAAAAAGLTGCTARAMDEKAVSAGDPIVSDPISALTRGRGTGSLRRHPEAFFQGNRFLVPDLVASVLEAVPDGDVLDLYAGVGLFSVALVATGPARVIAVEGDPVSGRDLVRNASAFGERLRVVRTSVEAYLSQVTGAPSTILVDPPRTGMSKEACEAVARSGAERVVYVSCDPPTMARDGRRLLDAGYELGGLQGFDLFPNTAHVETLGVFRRAPGR